MAEIGFLRLAARILRFPRNDARSGSRYRDEAEQFTIRGFTAFDAYEQAGDQEFLDVAVTALRNAEAITPPGHPSHAARLANLGEALFARFERTGSEQGAKLTWMPSSTLPGALSISLAPVTRAGPRSCRTSGLPS